MSDIGEAFGTAAEGALLSRAVDGEKGRPLVKGHFAEGECLNCGTKLIGTHCHSCGQKAHLHRTLGAFMHDLLHGALHFEGRTWKTLPRLLFKPGELTRRYIDGERARFVSPMALFLFVIFLMFAVFQIAGIGTPTDFDGDATTASVRDAAAIEIGNLEGDIASIDAQLAEEDLGDEAATRLRVRREGLTEELEAIRSASALLPGETSDTQPAQEVDDSVTVRTETGDDATVRLPLDDAGGNWKLNGVGSEWFEAAIEKWRKNPSLMLYKLQTNFYKFSWLLIPLSIPFVWLLFAWKRRFKAYDHAIFVTYSLSFMTLLILALVLLGLAGTHPLAIVLASLLVPPLHMYKQLRGTYGLSRFSALWRLALLSIFILIVLTLFLQLLLLLGAM